MVEWSIEIEMLCWVLCIFFDVFDLFLKLRKVKSSKGVRVMNLCRVGEKLLRLRGWMLCWVVYMVVVIKNKYRKEILKKVLVVGIYLVLVRDKIVVNIVS